MNAAPLTAAVLLGTLWLAPLPASRAPLANAAGEEESALHECMEEMKDHLKAVALALKAGDDRDGALKHLTEMQRLTLVAKVEAPANLDEVPEAQREAHRVAFRADLIALLQLLAEIELDVLHGKDAAALERLQGALHDLRESSHDKYQKAGEHEEDD